MTTEGSAADFSCLLGSEARASAALVDHKLEHGEMRVDFSDGSSLRADYWRALEDGSEVVSSFDHQQQYGLPEPVDAIRELNKLLMKNPVTEVSVEKGTGDLLITFSKVQLRVFGFTGYEAWELRLSNGRVGYSNYSK